MENLAEERGTLNCCAHVFCAKCIKPWAKVNRTCPLDRKRINTIYVGSQADVSFKRMINVETIKYAEFFLKHINSAPLGNLEEDRVKYLLRKVLALNNIRWQVIHRLRADDCFTMFVDSDESILTKNMILIDLSARIAQVRAELTQ